MASLPPLRPFGPANRRGRAVQVEGGGRRYGWMEGWSAPLATAMGSLSFSGAKLEFSRQRDGKERALQETTKHCTPRRARHTPERATGWFSW
jgi:hypothetical protein